MSKRVSFTHDIIFFIPEDKTWQDYRKTYWEFERVNRFRFQERMKRTEIVLRPILEVNHRKK